MLGLSSVMACSSPVQYLMPAGKATRPAVSRHDTAPPMAHGLARLQTVQVRVVFMYFIVLSFLLTTIITK